MTQNADQSSPMTPETVAEAIESAQRDWVLDGRMHDLYVYIVNALGLDPDLPVETLRGQLTFAEKHA